MTDHILQLGAFLSSPKLCNCLQVIWLCWMNCGEKSSFIVVTQRLSNSIDRNKNDCNLFHNGIDMDVSGEFWSRFDTWAGPTFGVILLCVGAFLMFRGATKIKILSFLTGCAIGQLSATILWGEIGSFTTLSEGDFTLAATVFCGLVMSMVVRLMSLAVTGYISLQTMLWIVSMLEANGYDVGTGIGWWNFSWYLIHY